MPILTGHNMPPGVQRAPTSSSPRPPLIDISSPFSNVRAASTASSTSPFAALSAVDALWDKLEAHRHRHTTARTTTYFNADVVAPNHTGVLCPDNAHTLRVQLGQDKDQRTPLHANHVRLGHCYAVGQSPGGRFEDACTRDLIHSLDSGKGLFQFTSRNAHRVDIDSTSKSTASTVADMLATQWKKSGPGMRLGGRYAVEDFCVVPNNPPQSNVTRYQITACEIKNGRPDPDTRKTVFITQAGLRFVNKLLQPEEIAHAATLFATHPPSTLTDAVDVQTHPQSGPLICSAAGIGRSAVLAVYQDLCLRMPDEVNQDTLDSKLEEAIAIGIDARGPKFLHSKAQLAALRQALVAKINEVPRSTAAGQAICREVFDRLSPKRKNQAADTDTKTIAATRVQSSGSPISLHRRTSSADIAASAPTARPTLATAAQTLSTADVMPSSASTVSRPVMATSDADISRLAVDAIVVRGDSELVKRLARAAPSTSGATGIGQSNTNSSSSISSVIETDLRPWNSARPHKFHGGFCKELNEANERKAQSIGFAADVIALAPTIGPVSSGPGPEMRAAALAVATAARYIADATTSIKTATFHCITTVQKKCYDNLLERVDTLAQHRVFEALMRPSVLRASTPTAANKFFETGQIATYVPPEINGAADNCSDIIEPSGAPQGQLHGVPFKAWADAPTTVHGWNTAADQVAPGFHEPDVPPNIRAAGAVIVEKDGRVWVVAPTNQFCHLKNTFPKGRIDKPGLTARGCAVMEAYEESGLQIRLTRHLTDSRSGSTRYYLAERIGGTPADVGWESQAVSLVPQSELAKLFDDGDRYNHHNEKLITAALQQPTPASVATTHSANLDLSAAHQTAAPDLAVLNDLLANNEGVQITSRDTNERIQVAMREMATDPDRIVRNQKNIALHGSSLSNRINNAMDAWRQKNCGLVKNSDASQPILIERHHSRPPHARTLLKSIGNATVPYLHANHIPLDSSIAFIAAQRPLSNPAPGLDNSNTFWQTLLHEKVSLIVDLTEANEKPRELPYGPSNNADKNIGSHTLHLTSGATTSRHLRTEKIDARDLRSREISKLTRLHFTGWKDKTAISADALIALAEQVVDASKKSPGNVLIHCSHGVGRTGTLITFMAASEQIEQLLQTQRGMPIEKLTQLVIDIVMRGRIERGPHFVSAVQFPVIIEALLKKHFGGVENDFLTMKKNAH